MEQKGLLSFIVAGVLVFYVNGKDFKTNKQKEPVAEWLIYREPSCTCTGLSDSGSPWQASLDKSGSPAGLWQDRLLSRVSSKAAGERSALLARDIPVSPKHCEISRMSAPGNSGQ